MSGLFNTQRTVIRSLRASSMFTKYCRSLQTPLPLYFQNRHASIWAISDNNRVFSIESNGLDDNEINKRLEKSPTISKFLGIAEGHFGSEKLANQNEKFFKTKIEDKAQNTITKRTIPKEAAQVIVSKQDNELLDLQFSNVGKEILMEDRGTMERTLSLLPEKGLIDTIKKTEDVLSNFAKKYEIENARYLEADLYFPTPVLVFKQPFVASLLSQSKTLSEAIYAPDEAQRTPIDTLDKKGKADRIQTVLANKFGIRDESLKAKISVSKGMVTTPGFISAHRTCAVLLVAKHKETNETCIWVSNFEVEMANTGTLNLANSDTRETIDFSTKGLVSGANFAYGGEAGDVSKAIGGDYLLRQYASEEEAMSAIFGVVENTQTRHSNIYTEDVISPEAAACLIARNLLMRDNITGIYSDYPKTVQNHSPVNNCGSICWEQKSLVGLPVNPLELTMPTSELGDITVSLDDLTKDQPDYWLHIALRSGLNGAYAVQWAECVFSEIKKTHNIKTTKSTEDEIKEQLQSMFIDAFFGLNGAAVWQELFVEYHEGGFEDENLRKKVKAQLEGPLGMLALMRPASVVMNFGKLANAYSEFLEQDGNGDMLEFISLVNSANHILEAPKK